MKNTYVDSSANLDPEVAYFITLLRFRDLLPEDVSTCSLLITSWNLLSSSDRELVLVRLSSRPFLPQYLKYSDGSKDPTIKP